MMSGTIDLVTDNIYAMLVSGSYTPSTSHTTYTDVSPYQTAGQGYSAGGQLLTSKSIYSVGNAAHFDASDVTWSNSSLTASGVVLWYSGGPTTRHLITWIELGNQSSTNGIFQIVWNNTNGIFRVYGE